MDTSKEYVKMCKELPDNFINLAKDRTGLYLGGVRIYEQDRLQEMLIDHRMVIGSDIFTLVYGIYSFAEDNRNLNNKPVLPFHSMEQLWLAFVMKEKFNKIWNGKDWKGLNG